MTYLTNNFRSASTRTGLYCVWVPLRDNGRSSLVSIWADSRMTLLESGPLQESTGIAETTEDAVAEETENPDSPSTVSTIGVDSAERTGHRMIS